MRFHRLIESDNGMSISQKKPFPPNPSTFKPETIKLVFDFAFAMTFGSEGEHRNHRTGGSNLRKNGEIFADTFQGKLAECAACNLLYKIDPSVMPDFSISKLGVWDTVDVVVKNKRIAVKSTKSFGNLLLLEQHDWDAKGRYIPNIEEGHSNYDYFLLIRIKPGCDDVMKSSRWLYANAINKDDLWAQIQKVVWSYDYAGYITQDHLKHIIRERYILPKGALLNGSTRMDADNYYIQAGDMPEVIELLSELNALNAVTRETTSQSTKPKKKWYSFLIDLIRRIKPTRNKDKQS